MNLCIGERVHDPNLSQRQVRRWAKCWRDPSVGTTFDYVRLTPAMTRGPTRTRLLKFLGSTDVQVWNLLPPDREIGTWDPVWAREVSRLVVGELEEGQFFMLGMRVAAAFTGRALEPGEVVELKPGLSAMMLPHPSGRNRFWNDSDRVLDLREKVLDWMKEKQ